MEPLSGYLTLMEKLANHSNLNGEGFIFGPKDGENHPVESVINEMKKTWDAVSWTRDPNAHATKHEAKLLSLDCSKAKRVLDWESRLSFEEGVRMTVEWYKAYYQESKQIGALTSKQIESFGN